MELIKGLVVPSGLAYALFFLGLLAAVAPRLRKHSWWLLVASGAINVVFSSGKVAAALMSPLEYSHTTNLTAAQQLGARRIVVLTGWASDDPNMPLSAQMNATSLYRVLYAFELYREHPDWDVIVSGSEVAGRIMGQMLLELGVPQEQLRIDSDPLSTAGSAATLQALLEDNHFLLVTSAGHMPRALGVFEKQGLNAHPAPTDFQLPKDWRFAETKPSSSSLTVSDLAIHEYVGLAWYRLRGLL